MLDIEEQYTLARKHLSVIRAGQKSNYLDDIDLLPHDQFWMLCVDAKDHQYGRLEYNCGFFRGVE